MHDDTKVSNKQKITPDILGQDTRILARTRLEWRISTFLAVGFIASLVFPYLGLLGKGVWSTWSLFIAWLFIFASENRRFVSSVLSACRRRRFELLMLSGWLIVVLMNAVLGRGYTGWQHMIAMVSLCMIVFIQITYSSLKPEVFRTILFWTMILLGINMARSLPVLLADPGIAKFIMLRDVDPVFQYQAYIAGVGDYDLYTASAITFPVFLAIAFSFSGIKRIMLMGFCICIGLAVVFSTFTGAVSIMVMGVIAFALLSYMKSQKKILIKTLRLGFVFLVILVLFYSLGDKEPVTNVTSKIVRLYKGITESGVVSGDETGRGELFMLSLETFLHNAFMGVGPCTTRENPWLYTYVGGHSSWIDQLAEYGILGFGWFIVFALIVTFRVVRNFMRYKKNFIIRATFVSCVLYFIGGVVNPVLFVNSISVFFYLLVLGSMESSAMISKSQV